MEKRRSYEELQQELCDLMHSLRHCEALNETNTIRLREDVNEELSVWDIIQAGQRAGLKDSVVILPASLKDWLLNAVNEPNELIYNREYLAQINLPDQGRDIVIGFNLLNNKGFIDGEFSDVVIGWSKPRE